MIHRLQNKHHFEFLSLKGGFTTLSEKSNVTLLEIMSMHYKYKQDHASSRLLFYSSINTGYVTKKSTITRKAPELSAHFTL